MKSNPTPPRRTTLPPQLADLLAEHGRWDLIPPEAWTAYDAQCAQWYAAHRANQTLIKS